MKRERKEKEKKRKKLNISNKELIAIFSVRLLFGFLIKEGEKRKKEK